MTKSKKTKASPDKLSKTSKKAGIALTESELGQVSGGAGLKLKLKI